MSPPLLPQLRPDLSDDYWRVKQLPALTTEQLGVRVNVDHWLRVQRARLTQEQHQGAAVAVKEGR